MNQHLLHNCRTLHHTSVRRKIPLQHSKSSRRRIRLVDRTDHFRVSVDRMCNVLSHGLSRHRHAVRMQKPLLIQLRHHRIDAARLIKVFHIGRACRGKVAEVRRLLTDAVCKVNLKIHADLMCDRRKMQHTVRRTSKSHIHRKGIQDRLLGHDVSWQDILLKQLHHLHTRLLRKTDPCRIDCRDGSISAKPHSKNLR